MTDTGEQGERAVETPGQRYYVLTIYSNHYENFADAEDHTFVTFEAHLSTVRELLSTLMYELLWTRTDPYRIEVRRVYTGKVWRRGTLVGNVDGGGAGKMTVPEGRTCQRCAYFDTARTRHTGWRDEVGVCRRSAPRVAADTHAGHLGVREAVWPVVDGEVDWCGELKPDPNGGPRRAEGERNTTMTVRPDRSRASSRREGERNTTMTDDQRPDARQDHAFALRDAYAHNLAETLERGPGLRYSTRTVIVAVSPDESQLLEGGLGAMGVGEEWIPVSDYHREDPLFEQAPRYAPGSAEATRAFRARWGLDDLARQMRGRRGNTMTDDTTTRDSRDRPPDPPPDLPDSPLSLSLRGWHLFLAAPRGVGIRPPDTAGELEHGDHYLDVEHARVIARALNAIADYADYADEG